MGRQAAVIQVRRFRVAAGVEPLFAAAGEVGANPGPTWSLVG